MTKEKSTTASKSAAYTTDIPHTPMRFVWFTTKPFLSTAAIGLFFSATTQLLNTYTALFIGDLTTAAQTGLSTAELTTWAGLFIGLMASVFISFRAAGFIAINFVLKQHALAFDTIKSYLLKQSHTYFINRFAGSLAGKVFHAGDRSSELLIMSYYGVTRFVVSFVATGIVIALFSNWLAFVYFFILLITVGINFVLVKRRRPHVVAYAEATSKYRGQVTDVVTNIQAVRQYAAFNGELSWLGEVQGDRISKDKRQWTMSEWNHVVNNVLGLIMMMVVIGSTYRLLLVDMVSVGAMVTAMILMYRVSGIMVDLGDWMNRFVRVYGEVEEGLGEILLPIEIVDLPNAATLSVSKGKVVWNNVTFDYDNNRVFDDFSLTIKPGERLGLVGPSGAGKTTFVSLLLRQHDLTDGSIEIDGQNIATVTQDSLRENIAVVPQEPLLFHRSIRENIAYGKPGATETEIIEVAKKAQAHDFISALPEGYDTLVGERGVKLSGGQKQRVAIARAMLKDAPILVLDEATSALDSESEVAIQKALHELMEGKTVVAIAHRLSTLREMDRIIVLENGQITEDGTHNTLSKAGGTYARLWEHQAGGFLSE